MSGPWSYVPILPRPTVQRPILPRPTVQPPILPWSTVQPPILPRPTVPRTASPRRQRAGQYPTERQVVEPGRQVVEPGRQVVEPGRQRTGQASGTTRQRNTNSHTKWRGYDPRRTIPTNNPTNQQYNINPQNQAPSSFHHHGGGQVLPHLVYPSHSDVVNQNVGTSESESSQLSEWRRLSNPSGDEWWSSISSEQTEKGQIRVTNTNPSGDEWWLSFFSEQPQEEPRRDTNTAHASFGNVHSTEQQQPGQKQQQGVTHEDDMESFLEDYLHPSPDYVPQLETRNTQTTNTQSAFHQTSHFLSLSPHLETHPKNNDHHAENKAFFCLQAMLVIIKVHTLLFCTSGVALTNQKPRTTMV